VILGEGDVPSSATGAVSDASTTQPTETATNPVPTTPVSSLSVSLVNPPSGKSTIFNDQYVNLRWK
jgi:hypothetical protein